MTDYKVKASFDIEFKTKPHPNAVMALNNALNAFDAVLMSNDNVFEDWELKKASVKHQEKAPAPEDERTEGEEKS